MVLKETFSGVKLTIYWKFYYKFKNKFMASLRFLKSLSKMNRLALATDSKSFSRTNSDDFLVSTTLFIEKFILTILYLLRAHSNSNQSAYQISFSKHFTLSLYIKYLDWVYRCSLVYHVLNSRLRRAENYLYISTQNAYVCERWKQLANFY